MVPQGLPVVKSNVNKAQGLVSARTMCMLRHRQISTARPAAATSKKYFQQLIHRRSSGAITTATPRPPLLLPFKLSFSNQLRSQRSHFCACAAQVVGLDWFFFFLVFVSIPPRRRI